MEMDCFVSLHRAVGEDKYEVVQQQSLTPRTDKTYKSKEAFVEACRAHPDKVSPSGIRLIILAKKTLMEEGWSVAAASLQRPFPVLRHIVFLLAHRQFGGVGFRQRSM